MRSTRALEIALPAKSIALTRLPQAGELPPQSGAAAMLDDAAGGDRGGARAAQGAGRAGEGSDTDAVLCERHAHWRRWSLQNADMLGEDGAGERCDGLRSAR